MQVTDKTTTTTMETATQATVVDHETINPLSALQTAMLEVHETSTDEPSWCQCSRNKKCVLRILTAFSCDEGHTAHRYYEITPNLEGIITLSCSP